MPLTYTQSYSRSLRILQRLSPAVSALSERIAFQLRPEVLATCSDALEAQMLDHMTNIAMSEPRAVIRLGVWLSALTEAKALTLKQGAEFMIEATSLAGPYVTPDEY